jgi:hypothetical protein
MASNIVTAFNNHFTEFLEDIQSVFPEDQDIQVAKNSLLAIRKANPRLIVKIWNTFIVGKYKSEIENGNIDFFLNKDYSQDLANADNAGKILESIDRLREPIRSMSQENKSKCIKYIQNLTKLAAMCDN